MNIGETITVRALSPLWANRKAYAYPIAQYQSFTGPVLPNPVWVGADRICIGTGDVAFPFRVIEKAAIEGYSQVSVAPMAPQRTWAIPGAKPNQSYLVTREGARWGCNCVGFGYRRTCTHVTTAKAQFEGAAVPSKQKKEKKSQQSNKLPVDLIPLIPYPKNRLKLKRALPPTFENGVYTMAKQYTGTNRAKVAAIMADNADLAREACIALIAQLGSMPYATAKAGYQRAVRLGLAPGSGKAAAPKAAKPTKGSLEKSVRAINAKQKAKTAAQHLGLADSAEAIAKVKEANLQRMREVSAKLKPKGKVRDFGGRVANVEPEGVYDFDPNLAREEVDAILRDERLIDVCPKFVREDA
jgi:hypothetical protein